MTRPVVSMVTSRDSKGIQDSVTSEGKVHAEKFVLSFESFELFTDELLAQMLYVSVLIFKYHSQCFHLVSYRGSNKLFSRRSWVGEHELVLTVYCSAMFVRGRRCIAYLAIGVTADCGGGQRTLFSLNFNGRRDYTPKSLAY